MANPLLTQPGDQSAVVQPPLPGLPAPSAAPTSPPPGAASLTSTLPPGGGGSSGEDPNPLHMLGDLFGQGNGSPFGGIPLLGDIGRAPGVVSKFAVDTGGLAVSSVAGGIGGALARIPMGWAGSDADFSTLGANLKVTDPAKYAEWQAVEAAANDDVLYGGNMKNNFYRDTMVALADNNPNGVTGLLSTSPRLAFGPSASLGGMLSDVLSGLANFGLQAQVGLESLSIHVPEGSGLDGLVHGTDRLTSLSQLASTSPDTLSDVEKYALQHYTTGAWDERHALSFLTRNGEGVSHDAITQFLVGLAVDPMTWAGVGEAALMKLGTVGEAALAAGKTAATAENFGQKLAIVVREGQTGPLAPAAKIVRALVDPLGAAPSRAKPLVDLMGSAASQGVGRAYGAPAVSAVFDLATTHGFTDELMQAFGGYSSNVARGYMAVQYRASELLNNLGRHLIDVTPDSVVGGMMKLGGKDAVTQLADHAGRLMDAWLGTPAQIAAKDAQLASRLTASFGRSAEEWAVDVGKMSVQTKSLLHAITYADADRGFMNALAKVADWGASKLKNPTHLVLTNDQTLDDVIARSIGADIKAAKTIDEKMELWRQAQAKYSAIADLGAPAANKAHISDFLARLEAMAKDGSLHTRATEEEMASLPQVLKDFLSAHPDWNLGFRPADEHAWGLKSTIDGALTVDRTPFVSHVADAALSYQPTADVVRNYLGRVVGTSTARTLTRPLDALEIGARTATDQISGARLMDNVSQRLSRNLTKLGLSAADSKAAWRMIREASGEGVIGTTPQGMSPANIWKSVAELGTSFERAKISQDQLFLAMMDATEGDLRIMGLTSKLSQHARTVLTSKGMNPNNTMGMLSVTAYRTLRFTLNPTFALQRMTDMPYFNALRGIMPVGGKELSGELQQLARISRAMGDTATARDLAMDFPEMNAFSDFGKMFGDKINSIENATKTMTGIQSWPGRMIFNNRIKFLHSQMRSVVKDTFDEIEKAHPGTLGRTFDDLSKQYSEQAGRVLTADEVGQRYLQEIVHDSLTEVRGADGTLSYRTAITKAEWHTPGDVGELGRLDADYLVHELGVPGIHSVDDLRSAIKETIDPVAGTGTHSVEWLRETLTNELGAHKDYVDRMVNYLRFDWREYHAGLATKLGMTREEGLQLENIIGATAEARHMTPSEFLSQVAVMNAGGFGGLGEEMGKLLRVVREANSGKMTDKTLNAVAKAMRWNLDLSTQKTLVEHFVNDLPKQIAEATAAGNATRVEELQNTLASLKGAGLDTSAVAKPANDAFDAAFADTLAQRASSGVAHVNPDVERAMRFYSQWTQKGLVAGLKDSSGGLRDYVKERMAGIPTDGGVPYNQTEALVHAVVKNKMRLAQNDAIRLAHAQTTRSVLERSLNHPIFGLYPSSYMWGKVMPEIARFVARDPFGMQTGTMAYQIARAEQYVAIKREYDPEFANHLDEFAGSAPLLALSYATPSLPWDDMRANLPPLITQMGKTGTDMGQIAESEWRTIDPRRWASIFAKAGGQVLAQAGNVLHQNEAPPPTIAPQQQQGLQTLVQPSGGAPAPSASPTLTEPTTGAGLTPVLVPSLVELQKMLAGQ